MSIFNRTIQRILYAQMVCLLIAVPAFASVFEPSWRGDENTVYAEWVDWIDSSPSDNYVFNADSKHYGAGIGITFHPQAVQLEAPVTGPPVEVLSTFEGHTNVLKVNQDGLYVTLPNFLAPEADHLLLRFEITYYIAYASFDGLIVTALGPQGPLPGYDNTFIVPDLVKSTQDDDWLTELYEFTIAPNPRSENIEIRFNSYPDSPQDPEAPYIDAFSFDTICVPEPSSLILIALGGMLLPRRR